mmetsp:Transcript_24826/g.45552  ORF Transcript_24826/g.45552 Transcript_24826/m.45552 type:complete len:201 (+) Transcript_24826:340-942(+)
MLHELHLLLLHLLIELGDDLTLLLLGLLKQVVCLLLSLGIQRGGALLELVIQQLEIANFLALDGFWIRQGCRTLSRCRQGWRLHCRWHRERRRPIYGRCVPCRCRHRRRNIASWSWRRRIAASGCRHIAASRRITSYRCRHIAACLCRSVCNRGSWHIAACSLVVCCRLWLHVTSPLSIPIRGHLAVHRIGLGHGIWLDA